MRSPEAIVAAARRCVGARFRPHGRDPRWGLDCVGVAAAAFGRPAPGDYPLRGWRAAAVAQMIDAMGLRRSERRAPGLLLLGEAGWKQLHLMITTDTGFIHAHAGLRRVVETPGVPEWPIIAAWTEGA